MHLDAKWPASESWKSGKISIHMCKQRKTEKTEKNAYQKPT